MTAPEPMRRAEPIEIEHTGRSVSALEWSSVGSGPTIVVAVLGDIEEVAGPVAEKLMDRNRVIGVNLDSPWDPVTISWWAADPVILVAQGEAGRTACQSAVLAPGALRALVLADYVPDGDEAQHSKIAVPALVFHGRDSSSETHAQAVGVHGDIPGSHLIELDGCAELPTKNCATALAESLTWYLAELGKPVIEFEGFAGSDAEPVDPRS